MAAPYYILKKKVLFLIHTPHSSSRICLLLWQSLLSVKRVPLPRLYAAAGI